MKEPANERAVLIYVALNGDKPPIEEDLAELKELSATAGAVVFTDFIQYRDHFDPAFVMGKGKLREIAEYVEQKSINTVIFYNTLSNSQRRNIQSIVNAKVIDRTELILDIFALHARTLEAKYQVELAQLSYRISHLTGRGAQYMQQTGGIGTRGPGEKKLEIERRRIRWRIDKLKTMLEKVKKQRRTRMSMRKSVPLPMISLVGYTNTGKSTLMNRLTGEDVYRADKLFATLTTTTRKLMLPGKKLALLSDTVGFIKNLPHNLVASFRSTLEEIVTSDMIIHVVDGSASGVLEQVDSVMSTLDDLKIKDKIIITAINKADKADAHQIDELLRILPDSVAISALHGRNIEELLKKIESKMSGFYGRYKLQISFEQADILAKIKKYAFIEKEHYLKNNLIELTFLGHKNIISSVFKKNMEEYEI